MVDRIRDYSIVRKLGEGGMGTVYLATDSMLDRNVAIKVLNPEFVEDQAFVARFKQEAKVQSALRHSNIVALHTFFQEDGKYCMVMEYAEGETLKSLIERTGPLPPDRAVRIMSQILEAVGHAHTTGIIHRDIKPSNIMIGSGDKVKVMDFGIAKILGERGMTRTGAKIGTLYYMSPEQVATPKDLDQRTDIYSLGIVLFEMLTGKLPLDTETDSDFELMQQIVERDLPSVTALSPGVPARVAQGLRMATVKNRDARTPSCESFRAMLLGDSPGAPLSKPAATVQPPLPATAKVGGWLKFFGVAFAVFAPCGLLYTLVITIAGLNQLNRWPYRSEGSMELYLLLNLLLSGLTTFFSVRAGAAILWKPAFALARVRTYSSVYLIAGLIGSMLPLFFGNSRMTNLPVALSMLLPLFGTLIWYFIVVNYFKKSRRVLDTLSRNVGSTAKPIAVAPSATPITPMSWNKPASSPPPGDEGMAQKRNKNRTLWFVLSVAVLGVLLFGFAGTSAAALVITLPLAVYTGVDFLIDSGMLRDQSKGERKSGRDVWMGFLAGVSPFLLPILYQSPENRFGTTTGEFILLAVIYAGGLIGISVIFLRYIERREAGPMTGKILGVLSRDTLASWGKTSAVIAALSTIVIFIVVVSSTSIPFFSWNDNDPLLYISQIIGAMAMIPIGSRALNDVRKEWIRSSSWALGEVTVSSVMLIPVVLSVAGMFRFGWNIHTPFTTSGGAVFDSAVLTSRAMVGIWLLVFVLARVTDASWPKLLLWTGSGGAMLGLMPLFALLAFWGGEKLDYVHGVICPSVWGETPKVFLSLILHVATTAFFGVLAYRWHVQDKT